MNADKLEMKFGTLIYCYTSGSFFPLTFPSISATICIISTTCWTGKKIKPDLAKLNHWVIKVNQLQAKGQRTKWQPRDEGERTVHSGGGISTSGFLLECNSEQETPDSDYT